MTRMTNWKVSTCQSVWLAAFAAIVGCGPAGDKTEDGLDDLVLASAVCAWEQGAWRYCRDCGPCPEGVGDCDSDDECEAALYCDQKAGVDLCKAACPWPEGHSNYCRDCGPCPEGGGDCDTNSHCKTGLYCHQQVGADVCVANGVYPVDLGSAPATGSTQFLRNCAHDSVVQTPTEFTTSETTPPNSPTCAMSLDPVVPPVAVANASTTLKFDWSFKNPGGCKYKWVGVTLWDYAQDCGMDGCLDQFGRRGTAVGSGTASLTFNKAISATTEISIEFVAQAYNPIPCDRDQPVEFSVSNMRFE